MFFDPHENIQEGELAISHFLLDPPFAFFIVEIVSVIYRIARLCLPKLTGMGERGPECLCQIKTG